MRESKTAFRAEPLESVNWESGAEGGVKESELVWHVGNSKESKSNDQRHRTCRGQRENESTVHAHYIYFVYGISQGEKCDSKRLVCSLNFL